MMIFVFSCDKFENGSSYICFSGIHVAMIFIAVLLILFLVVALFGNILFDHFLDISGSCPWNRRSIKIALIKKFSKVILAALQFMTDKIGILILNAFTFLIEVILLYHLIAEESYFYNYVQVVEILAADFLIWWNLGIILSDVNI